MQKLPVLLCTMLVLLSVYGPAIGEEKGAAYYDFGVFAYEDGDYGDAEMNFKKALGFEPRNPLYRQYLGKTYASMGRFKEALGLFEEAEALDPNLPGLQYDTAFAYYKMSEFARAAAFFEHVVREDPSDILAHYYAGICQFNLKKYGMALSYFETAAEKSPTIRVNGFYYAGICYVKMGDMGKAGERFTYVRDHADSDTLRALAAQWLDAVEKQKKERRPYGLYVKLGYRYDNNVQLEPEDLDIVTDEDDYVAVGFFSGHYNIINRPDIKLGAGYSHYQSRYDDLHQFDLVGSLFNVYTRYRKGPVSLGLSYLPAYYWLDSDGFLARHEFKPDLTWRINQKFMTTLAYSYRRDNHFADADRDGHTNEGSLDVYYTLGKKRGYAFAGIGYDDKTATHPDQYYTEWKARLGISLNLPWELKFALTGRYDDQEYDNVNSLYGVLREDAKYNGTASLSRTVFFEWLRVVGEFDYTKNESNIQDFEYKRKLYTLSLAASF